VYIRISKEKTLFNKVKKHRSARFVLHVPWAGVWSMETAAILAHGRGPVHSNDENPQYC
jgi:hypothetical protein